MFDTTDRGASSSTLSSEFQSYYAFLDEVGEPEDTFLNNTVFEDDSSSTPSGAFQLHYGSLDVNSEPENSYMNKTAIEDNSSCTAPTMTKNIDEQPGDTDRSSDGWYWKFPMAAPWSFEARGRTENIINAFSPPGHCQNPAQLQPNEPISAGKYTICEGRIEDYICSTQGHWRAGYKKFLCWKCDLAIKNL